MEPLSSYRPSRYSQQNCNLKQKKNKKTKNVAGLESAALHSESGSTDSSRLFGFSSSLFLLGKQSLRCGSSGPCVHASIHLSVRCPSTTNSRATSRGACSCYSAPSLASLRPKPTFISLRYLARRPQTFASVLA